MYLAIYDISGIQRYIFSTGKLREQIGASRIIHNILYQDLPKVLGEQPDDWEEENLFDFSEKPHHIVYIGGGNAVVLYKNKEYMENCTRELQKKVIGMTENKVRLCYAGIDIGTIEQSLNKKYDQVYGDLMKNMAEVKNMPSLIHLASGFAIEEQDPITKESIILISPDKEASNRKELYAPASRIEKQRAFKVWNGQESKRQYATQFEEFREEDRKSFVAVIHIDGDTMGRQIQRAVETFSKENNLEQSMLKMRALSKEIDGLYRKALDDAVENLYEKYEGQQLPFRPIITDGDDITVVMEAERAFEFVEQFMENLQSNKAGFPKMEEYGFKISASAGIAFVHDKFPFYIAYEIAEQLSKSAKDIKKSDVTKQYVSTMDFHIVRSGMRSNLKEYREETYRKKKDSKVYKLELRPYFFEKSGHSNTYESFAELRKRVRKETNEEGIARSKLKGLLNAYDEGVDAAERYYTFILSREEGGITGNVEEGVFDQKDCRARFFDVLDAMDL